MTWVEGNPGTTEGVSCKPNTADSGYPRLGPQMGHKWNQQAQQIMKGLKNEAHLAIPTSSITSGDGIEYPTTIPGRDKYLAGPLSPTRRTTPGRRMRLPNRSGGRALPGHSESPGRYRPAPHRGRTLLDVLFEPPYLHQGSRPQLQQAPDTVHHGDQFAIQTPDAGDVTDIVLVRPGAPTHHTDSEQRVVPVTFSQAGSAELSATAPNGTHPHYQAIRGHYMLFLLTEDGVPSEAEFILLH